MLHDKPTVHHDMFVCNIVFTFNFQMHIIEKPALVDSKHDSNVLTNSEIQ